MVVGIAMDAWKFTIFDRRLRAAGFTYTKHPGLAANTILLQVEVPSALALAEVVVSANLEAAKVGNN